METDFRYEFYNAGRRISELLRFSISPSSAGFNSDEHDLGCCGFWPLEAPQEGFFSVPADINSGHEVVRVGFAEDIQRRFGKWGVVRIDPNWNAAEKEDPEKEVSEYPIAANRDAAIERGKAIWLLHLRKIVEDHLRDCQNAMSAGGAPRAASGFTKKAFKLLGIADPGEQYFQGLKEAGKSAGSGQMNEALMQMQTQQSAMMGILLAVASGQKIDPELLKALLPQPGKPAPGMPVISGVATGEIKKPVGEFDPKRAGLEAYDRKTQDKSNRAKAAEKGLANS